MKIPYHKQQKEWFCGPAVMQMSLESFGIKKTQVQLAKEMKTTKYHGTNHKKLRFLAEKYNLKTYEKSRDGTITDLKNHLKTSSIVITCYYLPKEKTGHYAILKAITSKNIFLLDPYFGKTKKLELEQFKSSWHGTKTPNGWFITIKK